MRHGRIEVLAVWIVSVGLVLTSGRPGQAKGADPHSRVSAVDLQPPSAVTGSRPPEEEVVTAAGPRSALLLTKEAVALRNQRYGTPLLLQDRLTEYVWGALRSGTNGSASVRFDTRVADHALTYYWPGAPEGQRTGVLRDVRVLGEGGADVTHIETSFLREGGFLYSGDAWPARRDRPELEPKPHELGRLVRRVSRFARVREWVQTFFYGPADAGPSPQLLTVQEERMWGRDLRPARSISSFGRIRGHNPRGIVETLAEDDGRRAVTALLTRPLQERVSPKAAEPSLIGAPPTLEPKPAQPVKLTPVPEKTVEGVHGTPHGDAPYYGGITGGADYRSRSYMNAGFPGGRRR